MDIDNDFIFDDSVVGGFEIEHSITNSETQDIPLDDILHQAFAEDNSSMQDDFHESSDDLHSTHHSDISFGSSYSDAEIQKMESDVDMAEHEMKCRESDMNNWRSKVSLNDTKEHRANGDYDNAVRHFNEAQSKYNSAVSRYNSALSKLNNAK